MSASGRPVSGLAPTQRRIAGAALALSMTKDFVPLLLALGGFAASVLSHEATCEHPALVRGDFETERLSVYVRVRDDRDVDTVARRIAAKYQVEAKPVSSFVHGFMILNVTTEQEARKLAEQLRCDPDVEEQLRPSFPSPSWRCRALPLRINLTAVVPCQARLPSYSSAGIQVNGCSLRGSADAHF